MSETSYILMAEVGYMWLGNDSMEAVNANPTEGRESFTGPLIIRKQIGSTNYKVTAYFSRTSKESFEDKITRLIQNDALNGRADR